VVGRGYAGSPARPAAAAVKATGAVLRTA